MRVLAVLVLLLFAVPVMAGLPRADLAAVTAAPPVGARLDLSLGAPDISGRVQRIGEIMAGRVAFVVFADYTCNTLCGTSLQLLAAALKEAQLDPATYRILIIGLDPKDDVAAAGAMAERAIPADLRANAAFLLPDEQTIQRATQGLGFRYFYDPANDQFAHPAAVYLIAPDGAVRTTLSPFALTTIDIKQALAETAAVPSPFESVRLLCYGYDAAIGVYTAGIGMLMRISSVAAIVLLGSFVLLLVRARSKAR